jgi:hypothetical protein
LSKGPEFDDLVDEELAGDERERLRRAHELLLTAGPPPELPPSLEHPPDPEPKVRYLPQRRRFTVVGIAAALALVAFGAGYVAGGARNDGFATAFVVAMRGTALAPGASASIRIADRDAAGNWPMRFNVQGLPVPPKGAYYELYLSKNGKPSATCGTFIVHAGTTVVRLNAPYRLRTFSGWVVTRHDPGVTGEGPVVMTT